MPLSYLLAPALPFGSVEPAEVPVLGAVFAWLPFGDGLAEQIAGGRSAFAQQGARAVLHLGLLLLSTGVAARVLWMLSRDDAAVDEPTVQLVWRASLCFGVVSAFAYPVFAGDFFVSIAWGRMIVDGVSPYAAYFTPQSLEGLPLSFFEQKMTYGPVWGIVCAALAALGDRVLWIEFALFKAILLACWVASLWLVRAFLAGAGAQDRAVALCLLGWLPVSVQLTLAEGHNDVVMLAPALGWLVLAARARHGLAPLALAFSVLVKYVSVPFVALEGWLLLRRSPQRLGVWALGLAGGAALAFATSAPLGNLLDFLSTTAEMRDWRLLTPAHAIRVALLPLFPVPWDVVDALVLLAIAAIGVPILVRYLRAPVIGDAARLGMLGMLAACLVVVQHTWPWYALWPLGFAATIWRWRVAQLCVPFFLMAPFLHLNWLLEGAWRNGTLTVLVVYGGWIALLVSMRVLGLIVPEQRASRGSP